MKETDLKVRMRRYLLMFVHVGYWSGDAAKRVTGYDLDGKAKESDGIIHLLDSGAACLGYDINKDTLKYEVNSFEAEAVKLIFKMYLEGDGYTSIINELNRRGFKTKKGNSFGKNSLYDILRNERYCGVYVYNKCVHPDESGKFNRHAKKSDEDIIRIEGGIPQIISKEDFLKVQQKMNERKQYRAAHKATHDYLLSGKVVCGECGGYICGEFS